LYSISELNKQLQQLPPKKIAEICIRISKHKKENKELLDYLLNESDDEESFREKIKRETEQQFQEMNRSNLYLAKKSLRKILRTINKNCRFSGSKETEAILLIHFCQTLKKSGIPFYDSQVLINMYANQQKKIATAISKLHEDLQFDYEKELREL
jgi:hypothetical protein